jgi:hypothetical protein
MNASVKVMLSYDYCHFEIALSSDQDMTLSEVNEMRKAAHRLADNAVRQYKVAKSEAAGNLAWQKEKFYQKAEEIRLKPVSEWTPEDKAHMKILADRDWTARYDYDDDQGQF